MAHNPDRNGHNKDRYARDLERNDAKTNHDPYRDTSLTSDQLDKRSAHTGKWRGNFGRAAKQAGARKHFRSFAHKFLNRNSK